MLNTKLGYLALISALFISGIAIYFSVAGLAAIFSAYAISIIVMGTAIELGKLAGVVWLHYNYKKAVWWLKYGLMFLIVGVMFTTSMGIFGYLSKSHVEQTAQSDESGAQITRISTEIARNNAIILRSEQKIQNYEDNGSGVDASLNSQIDREQSRIDSAYSRVKPVIQVQLDIIAAGDLTIEARTKPYELELTSINQQLADLQSALSSKQIRIAQGIVGTKPDGSYKSKTVFAIKDFRTRNEARRNTLLAKIDEIRSTPSPAVANAQDEINRIRASAQSEISESNLTINKLRGRMGRTNANDIETLITAEQTKIKNSNTELDTLTEEKYKLEATFRKLEADVGPIKYIAEFVSDQPADSAMLEKAVKWLIILIIFVFDPFAILLLIAAQHSFDRSRAERLALTREHELETIDVIVDKEDTESKDTSVAPEFDSTTESFSQTELEPNIPKNTSHPEYEIEDLIKYYPPEPLSKEDNEWINAAPVGNEFVASANPAKTGRVVMVAPDPVAEQIRSGTIFPSFASPENEGTMFIRVDKTPTQLYISKNNNWEKTSKDQLAYSAYSHEYIKALIKRIGSGTYEPTLLTEAEKKHIETLLGRE